MSRSTSPPPQLLSLAVRITQRCGRWTENRKEWPKHKCLYTCTIQSILSLAGSLCLNSCSLQFSELLPVLVTITRGIHKIVIQRRNSGSPYHRHENNICSQNNIRSPVGQKQIIEDFKRLKATQPCKGACNVPCRGQASEEQRSLHSLAHA